MSISVMHLKTNSRNYPSGKGRSDSKKEKNAKVSMVAKLILGHRE